MFDDDPAEETKDIFTLLKAPRHSFEAIAIKRLFERVDQARVIQLAAVLKADIGENLPKIYGKRAKLSDYRTNPYVMLATASIMELSDPAEFANFLFNSKLAMGLETSFGKIVERAFLTGYPCVSNLKWSDPSEKLAEFLTEKQAEGRAAKAAIRNNSIWREIDKDVIFGNRRYMTSIKSGPNTINDTQVQGMVDAITSKHQAWLMHTDAAHPGLEGIDIVIGLTYGTEKTTNNKDNQILAKLFSRGFSQLDQKDHPGVLVDDATGRVRVYRKVGKSFWSWVGDPTDEMSQPQVFLEILLALAMAFKDLVRDGTSIEEGINSRLQALAAAMLKMSFAKDTLPDWVDQHGFSDDQLFYFATALSAFYDDGI
jgi:hypothetical protein